MSLLRKYIQPYDARTWSRLTIRASDHMEFDRAADNRTMEAAIDAPELEYPRSGIATSMIANRLTMRAAVIRPTLSLPTSEDDPFAPVADLSILGSTIHRAMPCVVWEDTERAANS